MRFSSTSHLNISPSSVVKGIGPIDRPFDDLCLVQSKSEWPIRDYIGRWSCSLGAGHEGPHIAYEEHNLDGEIVWEVGWEDD